MKNENRKMKNEKWGRFPVGIFHFPFSVLRFSFPFLLITAASCDRPGNAAPSAPQTRPAAAPAVLRAADAIYGFRNGGGLTGQSEPLPPPPMVVRWTYQTEASAGFEGGATISSDTVYIADDHGSLAALDLITGKPKWLYKVESGFATTPIVTGGLVMLGDLDGVFHCVSASEGKKIWSFDSESAIHASANASGTDVVFANDGGQLFCLDMVTGKKKWVGTAGDRVNSAPAIGNGAAYFSGCDAHLRALTLADGKEVCDVDLGALSPGSPALLADRVIVGTDRGRIVCFTPDGKQQLWAFEKVTEEAMVASSPAVSDAIVVAGARDRKVYALNAMTGNLLWDFETHGDVDSSPLISAGRVYFGSKDKKLYVLDLKTGKELWSFATNRGISAPPAIGSGVLVIGDVKGNVYCLEGKK